MSIYFQVKPKNVHKHISHDFWVGNNKSSAYKVKKNQTNRGAQATTQIILSRQCHYHYYDFLDTNNLTSDISNHNKSIVDITTTRFRMFMPRAYRTLLSLSNVPIILLANPLLSFEMVRNLSTFCTDCFICYKSWYIIE